MHFGVTFQWPWLSFGSLGDLKVTINHMGISKALTSLDGRMRRGHFWIIFITLLAISIPIKILQSQLYASGRTGHTVSVIIFCLWLFPSVWVLLAISVKRLHDLGYTGMFVLIWLVPYLGAIILLILLGFFPGTPERNKYGRVQSHR